MNLSRVGLVKRLAAATNGGVLGLAAVTAEPAVHSPIRYTVLV